VFDVNGWEVIILAVVAVVVLGPERLPVYAARLGQYVRQFRGFAEGARTQLREQMGPEFDDVNWRQFDPRQYDPRRIVREALADTPPEGWGDADAAPTGPAAAYDPARPTPWDREAT